MIILSFRNMFAETVMGTSLQNFGAFQQQYLEAVNRVGELLVDR